ncbi:MAG: response regulator [Acidobacteriaceae bacterium]|nr:response regulator [Acidobacteriaceae bacterium]
MESIGNLAGGIAHDFNNLLTVILGHSQKALSDLDGGNPLREKVAEIQAAGQRAASLTSQLLAFSRKQVLKPQILEINSVVSNISEMLGRLLGEDIQMSLHLDPKAGHVEADPTQLEQVLVNLAVNARDAMPNGGELVIESRSLRLDRHAAALNGLEPGPYVLLAVRDTGCGMDEQTQARIFEPFFTTKEVGKGTGLGLSTVLGVVQQSGGTVTVYSETGVGTTFKIYLPLVDAPDARIAESDECNLAAAPAGGTILLVEDEPSLRALAREVLREAGYVVFEAKNGREALQLANDLACPPDLLLTDVVMPEMSGVAVAAELQKKWPGLTVLCTSGYTDHALLERGALPQDIRFLQKPYMPESLLEQVAAVLRSRKRQANEESAESLLVSSI